MTTFNQHTTTNQLYNFKAANKLNKKDFLALVEAFRRFIFLCNGVAINKQWLGLGSPSHYNPKFFKCTKNAIPRINNWWTLTPEGAALVESLVKDIKIPKDPKEKEAMNTFLFEFRG